ncbi:hypothetical protein, partial [Burkholderia contaminans]|uniref:hypothetical protein n=1 Tax=Burkholderia contaminans TaxID=488447 RepID=UPI001C2F0086
GNPILSDSTGEPPPSTFNYAWDIAHGIAPALSGRLHPFVPADCRTQFSLVDHSHTRRRCVTGPTFERGFWLHS